MNEKVTSLNGFEKRTAKKKAQVLQAAFELMNTPAGVSGLTMSAVAERSHTAKATIFKYFESKENLIQEVFLHFIEQMRAKATEELAIPRPFEEQLMTMARLKTEMLEQAGDQFYQDLMSYYTKKDASPFAQAMEEYTQNSYNLMLDLFHQGRKEGKIDLKYSDEFLMIYMQAMIEGVTQPTIYQKIKVNYTENWTEMLLKSLAPSPRGEQK